MVYFYRVAIRRVKCCVEGVIDCKPIVDCDDYNSIVDELEQRLIKEVEKKYPDADVTKDEISLLAFNRL